MQKLYWIWVNVEVMAVRFVLSFSHVDICKKEMSVLFLPPGDTWGHLGTVSEPSL